MKMLKRVDALRLYAVIFGGERVPVSKENYRQLAGRDHVHPQDIYIRHSHKGGTFVHDHAVKSPLRLASDARLHGGNLRIHSLVRKGA